MTRKILVTIWKDDVAPRFDLTSEVLIVTLADDSDERRKTLVLPSASAEELCQIILSEGINVTICGGIEQEFYDYLTWKQVKVIDSVIGPFEKAIELFKTGTLEAGLVLIQRNTNGDA